MSVEQKNLESSSGDSVAEHIPGGKGLESVSPQDKSDRDAPMPNDGVEPRADGEDVAEKEEEESGSPLDRTPSQAAKMGKKKIAVVMTALCVCICPDIRSIRNSIWSERWLN